MKIVIDSDNNIIQGPGHSNYRAMPGYAIIDIGMTWPESSPGQPYRKSECYWNGSEVVLKTQPMLDKDVAIKQLSTTDAKMPRALEDVIDLLITKNTIIKADLPQAVQTTYDLKKSLRATLV